MRFILKLILIAGLAYLGQLYYPWWMIMIVPFTINMIVKTKGSGAFFSSFLATGGLWFAFTWMAHQQSNDILTSKMASVLPLQGNAIVLIILTTFIGGLAGGLAGYTGNALRNIFIKPGNKKKDRHRRQYDRPNYMYR